MKSLDPHSHPSHTLLLITLVLATCCALLFGCDGNISTSPIPSEGYFPLRFHNRWTYDVTETGAATGPEVYSEEWVVVDDPTVAIGSDIEVSYTIEKYSAAKGTARERFIARDGVVLSLGSGTDASIAKVRYPLRSDPVSITGIISPDLPIDTTLTVEALANIEVVQEVGGSARQTYSDCLRIRGTIENVASSTEVLCLGVGVVTSSFADLRTARTLDRTLVFFEIRK